MIEFKKISEFSKGILYNKLVDAYSFNNKCKEAWNNMWKEYDDFFFNNINTVIIYILNVTII